MSASIPVENLTPEEMKIFNAEYPRLAAAFTSDRRVLEIFQNNAAFVLEACRIAKKEFKTDFRGINASSGFGWQLLRAEHLRRLTTDAGVAHTNWEITVGAQGWGDWIGTSTTFNQINEDAMVVLLAQLNYSPSPKSYAAIYRLANIVYPVWYFEWAMRMTDALKVWEFPAPMILRPRNFIYAQLKFTNTGEDIPAIQGITFAKASYLQLATPTLQSP